MDPRPSSPALRRYAALCLLCPLVLAAGCELDPVEPDPPVLMQGTFTPVDPDRTLAGSVAAVTQFGQTDISVSVQGMEPGESLAWHLREGTCAGDGDIFGSPSAYPTLQAGEEGQAEGETGFSLRLRPGRSYAAEITPSVGMTGSGALACADMGQQ